MLESSARIETGIYEKYCHKVAKAFREKVKLLCPEERDKLGWGTSMVADNLTTKFQGLGTVQNYIDAWHFSSDMNKCYFALDPDHLMTSHLFHKKILTKIIGAEATKTYSSAGTGDFVNTLDYQLITQMAKQTYRPKIRRILDFGAGYGRQMNLFCQHPGVVEYMAIEAIEDSYVTQSVYFKIASDTILNNCIFNESVLTNKFMDSRKLNIRHLLTPKMTLIPDQHYDLIICSNVLNEIEKPAFIFAIEQFSRVIKPGGIMYVKDHGLHNQPGHRFFDDNVLSHYDFALEYRPFVEDFKDIWTIPRIYRKYNSRTPTFFSPSISVDYIGEKFNKS